MNSTFAWWGIYPPNTDFQENSFTDYPLYVGDPIPDPNRVGDFSLRKLRELFYHPPMTTKSTDGWNWSLPLSSKTVWFDQIDGGQKFVLELAGYSKEQVSAEIINNTLVITTSRVQQFDKIQEYVIPHAEALDLERFSVTMENGLLEISFPPKKKDAPKVIKIL